MDTYSHLHPLLDQFEAASFHSLISGGPASSLPPAAVHGGVQFVSLLQNGTFPSTQKVPVVAAVGINYTQSKTGTTFPHLHRYLTDKSGRPTIEDKAPGMHRALNGTLTAHTRNGPTWVTGGRSSVAGLPAISSGYILVAINFVPYITIKPWLKLMAADQRGLLHCSTGLNFLRPLFSLLSSSVDLRVGHGKTVVWPLFHHLLPAIKLGNWVTTYNLSGLGCASMANARKNTSNPDHPYFM